MKRITILHLITGLNTGGAEMALLHLLEEMDRELFEMRVVCMIPLGPVGEKMIAMGIPVNSLGMPPGRPTLRGIRQLLLLIKQCQPSILQTWLYHADLLGLLAAKLCRVRRLVWNIRIAELDFSQYRILSGLVMRICALFSRLPNAVIVNSRAGQHVHTRLGYNPKEWIYIPNGINITRFAPNPESGQTIRQEWNIAPDEILIGQVGRLSPQKDHPTLLNAAAILQKQNPKVRLVCIGEGPDLYLCELKRIAANLGLTNLLWAGSRPDMPAVYNALDMLVSSSTGEGFPNVVAEAMACEKPCVVTNVGDSTYLIADSGFSVPSGDSVALANSLLRMSELSRIERAQLGKIARLRIESNFSINKMVSSYNTLYKKLTQEPSSRQV